MSGRQKTFVLVHGGWHGGWCWSAVAAILRRREHTVFTPTQTGLGERSHLLSPSIDLDLFITDIANVLVWEDLHDVELVGHSFGGITISGVADRMPERIRQLVYLDAFILENGQSTLSMVPPNIASERAKAAQESSGGLSIPPPPPSNFGIVDPTQAAYVESRLTPHPFGSYTSPLVLAHPVGNSLPVTYIVCTDPIYEPASTSRQWVKEAGWRTGELATGHDAMVIAPDLLADLLDSVSD
jgi:pimeloyl-ACP methyl ester carboxylesterase